MGTRIFSGSLPAAIWFTVNNVVPNPGDFYLDLSTGDFYGPAP
jgi:hypothetical protein